MAPLNSQTELMANTLTYLAANIEYLFIIKILRVPLFRFTGKKVAQLNKWVIVAIHSHWHTASLEEKSHFLNYSNMKSIQKSSALVRAVGGKKIPPSNCITFCPPKQKNQTYPNIGTWRCHLHSGSLCSLAEEGKNIMLIALFQLHLISEQFLTGCNILHFCSTCFLCFAHSAPPLHDPVPVWDWIWKCQTLQIASFCWCSETWQWDMSCGETCRQLPVHKPATNTHTHTGMGG